jgi:glyoxylate/hydroxypyruvate reductase A
MALLLITSADRVDIWRDALHAADPVLTVRLSQDLPGAAKEIEFVLCWQPEPGLLGRLPNLRAVFSIGAGVDHILRDVSLPARVPVVRMIDPSLDNAIVQYILLAVLRQHRKLDAYREQQARGVWNKLGMSNLHMPRIGILGLGRLGARAARLLAELGYPVAGWSRGVKRVDAVESHCGPAGLSTLLARTDILVSLLPSTKETIGILNADLFARLPRGAHIVNLGRGEHLVEGDLLAALDSGQVSGATLDVFCREPLPEGHPFWHNPKIIITPHDGGDTIPRTAAKFVTDNIERIRAGREPVGLIDREKGY